MPSLPEVHASIPVPSPHSPWTKKFGAFVGLGFMISVGYIDPGNWATDLTGYSPSVPAASPVSRTHTDA